MKNLLASCLAASLLFAGCGLFSEGDPVDAKTGITAKWQSDVDPGRIMEFKEGGQGHYTSENANIDQTFRYTFTDEESVRITFLNGQNMDLDVRTTTLYLWVTNEDGTERFHKYE